MKKKIRCPICKGMLTAHMMGFKSHLRHKHGIATSEAQRPIVEKLFPFETSLIKLRIKQQAQYKETKRRMDLGETVSKADLGLVIAMDQRNNRFKKAYYQ